MLVGCCHCGEEGLESDPPPSESNPSESTPSESQSESQSDDVSGIFINCQFCLGNIYPARVRLDIPAFGTPGVNHCAEYTGSYIIPNFGGGSVTYFSAEKVININTGLNTNMTAGPNPASRFVVSYSCGQSLDASPDVTVNIRWSTVASSSPGSLSSAVYTYAAPTGVGRINCLLPLICVRGAVSGGAGPCSGTWPPTVTLTPI
jgi:hypothetical protein